MNTPETINIEKYAEALNNLIGVDSAYFQGDENVDAIVEVIMAAKKLENRVKELEEEKEALVKNYAQRMKDYARDIFDEIDGMIYKLLNDKLYIAADMRVEIEELRGRYTEGIV